MPPFVPRVKSWCFSFPWIEPLLTGSLANRARWVDLRDKVEMGLTWIDHDSIEVPVEEVEVRINSIGHMVIRYLL